MTTQAKGRVERSFLTAQDRLVKGLRVAGVCTLADANRYLEEQFLPWWNQRLVVQPANLADAHRPLGPEHDLAAALSAVETRQVDNDYTIQQDRKYYQIERGSITAGLRGGTVRVEQRLDGTVAVRFRERYLKVSECQRPAKVAPQPKRSPARQPKKRQPSPALRAAMKNLFQSPALAVWQAAEIDRTRTRDVLD